MFRKDLYILLELESLWIKNAQRKLTHIAGTSIWASSLLYIINKSKTLQGLHLQNVLIYKCHTEFPYL